jgi:DNA-binding XRE family transcriptional regulator
MADNFQLNDVYFHHSYFFDENMHHYVKKHIVFPKPMKILEIFGENLKLHRKRRKLTSLQVAERAGIDRGTLRGEERGNPTFS